MAKTSRTVKPSLLRPAVAVAALALAALAVTQPSRSEARQTHASAVAAHFERCSFGKKVPCLGTIESLYDFEGEGQGATKLMWARFEPRPEGASRWAPKHVYWKAARGVEIVAAFAVYTGKIHYKRLKTGAHSGHATLIIQNYDPPALVLEGRRTAKSAASSARASRPRTSVQLARRGEPSAISARPRCFYSGPHLPCKGTIQSGYDFEARRTA